MFQNLTFRQLVDLVARHGLDVDERPRFVATLASACKISRAHFYNLLGGDQEARKSVVVRVARGLKTFAPWVTQELVEQSLARTQTLAGMKS